MQHIFSTILQMSTRGTVIFLILFLVRLCLKKLHSSHSYLVGLWMILFFYLVFPWKIELPVGFWQTQIPTDRGASLTAEFWLLVPYLWLTVASALMIHLLYTYMRLRRRLTLSLPHQTHIYRTEAVSSPMVFGLIHLIDAPPFLWYTFVNRRHKPTSLAEANPLTHLGIQKGISQRYRNPTKREGGRYLFCFYINIYKPCPNAFR